MVIWLFSAVLSSLLPFWEVDGFAKRFADLPICGLAAHDGTLVGLLVSCFYLTVVVATIMYALLFITMRRKFRARAKISVVKKAKLCPGPKVGEESGMQNQNGTLEESKGGPGDRVRHSVCESGVGGRLDHHQSNATNAEVGDPVVKNSVAPRELTSHEESTNGEEITGDASSQDNRHPITAKSVRSRSTTGALPSGARSVVRELVEGRRRASQSKERKLARTLGLIMGVFAACWLPFFLTYVVYLLSDTWRPSETLELIISWLGYVNSTLNPIILIVFNMQFRKAFKKLLHINT
jgi:hypothetical protein